LANGLGGQTIHFSLWTIIMRNRTFLLSALLLAGALASPLTWGADTIVIGRSLALSGPLKSYGEAKRDGADAYIAKVNQAGGVGGKQITLVTLDDEYLPPKTVANLKQLADKQSPTAFLGLFGVPTVAAALPVLLELKIPTVGLTSGTAALRTPHNPYSFPVRASYADEARKLVSHVKTIGITQISVIYTTNPFGESVKDSLLEALKKEGLSAVAVKLDPTGSNAKEAAAQVTAAAPQAVFLTMLSQAAVPMLRELKSSNSRALRYTFSPVDTTVVLASMGKDAAGLGISQIVPIPSGVRVPVVVEYTQALNALGRGTPSFYGLESYIEAKVLVEGLRRTKGNFTSDALLKALETMRSYDAGGFFVSYGPGDRTGSRFVEVDIIDSTGAVRR
jgi:branched-chain amino acid transport system substrate-binding protein